MTVFDDRDREVRKLRVAEEKHWLLGRVDGATPDRACDALIEADRRIDQLEDELASFQRNIQEIIDAARPGTLVDANLVRRLLQPYGERT